MELVQVIGGLIIECDLRVKSRISPWILARTIEQMKLAFTENGSDWLEPIAGVWRALYVDF